MKREVLGTRRSSLLTILRRIPLLDHKTSLTLSQNLIDREGRLTQRRHYPTLQDLRPDLLEDRTLILHERG